MEPGTQLGHYEIISPLGKGGMGEVWRARDTKLSREVAIKTLPPEFAEDPDRLARFEREARLLASLNHPNIAAIHGIEEHQGTRFLVLELVEGDTLAEVLKRGSVPVAESLQLALQIADALKAAHESGVVHRDLKPDNIKVTDDGNAKVLDFGLAKALAGEEAAGNVSNSPTLSMAATQAGVILGTAPYMSPEQAKGKSVDRRADVWAFGCVLYEMLTGRQSFGKSDVTESLSAVISLEPDWDALPRNLHPRLRETLERCLEKPVVKRYQDIGDVKVDIETVLADPAGTTVKPTSGVVQAAPQSRLPWVAAVALGMFIAGVAVWFLKPEPAQGPRMVSRFRYELPDEVTFRDLGRRTVTVSPTGEAFAFNATDGLHMRSMSEYEDRVIPGTQGGFTSPVFSPDGQNLAYTQRNDGIVRIDVNSGAPISVTTATAPGGMSWADDDSIVYAGFQGIWQVGGNGGTPSHLVVVEPDKRGVTPQLLPESRGVLYTRNDVGGDWDNAEIVVASLTTDEERVIREGGSGARYVSTGHLVYLLDDVLFAEAFDLESLERSGDAVSMIQGVRRAPANGEGDFSFSDNGTLVYVPGTAEDAAGYPLAVVDREGTPTPLPAPEDNYFFPRLSPDDQRVAVEVRGDAGSDIWVTDIETGLRDQLTTDGGERPIWTPDGNEITYLSGGALWTVASEAGAIPALLPGTEVPGIEGPGSWSPDGEVLLFASQAGIHAWRRDNPQSSEAAELVIPAPEDSYAEQPEFAPDGSWFAYISSDDAVQSDVYASPFPVSGTGRQRLTEGGAWGPVWVRQGGELIYQGTELDEVRAVEVTTGSTLQRSTPVGLFRESGLANLETDGRRNFDVTADGERFVVVWDLGPDVGSEDEGTINVVQNWFSELRERVPVD